MPNITLNRSAVIVRFYFSTSRAEPGKLYVKLLLTPCQIFVFYAPLAYNTRMLTIIESPLFTKRWPDYWSEEERAEFASFFAANPEAGDVIPGSGAVAGKFAGHVMVLVSVEM
jgi:hypothetical protein